VLKAVSGAANETINALEPGKQGGTASQAQEVGTHAGCRTL
jgi:hypothetical protein